MKFLNSVRKHYRLFRMNDNIFRILEVKNTDMKKISNKLPRKRKKAFKKANAEGEYMMQQILNEILFEEKGMPCRFPKLKRNTKNPKGYDIVGYW